MAERRMFAKTIIDSDAFTDMPISSQLLYFHLSMRADDDGFINNPKKIQRMVSCSDDDMKILIAKKFIIPFESGIVVIKHWKIHNYIRADRYNETKYKIEKSTLSLDENSAYSQDIDVCHTTCLPVGIPDDIPLVDTGKVRLGKDSIDKDNIFIIPTIEEVKAYCIERNNNVDSEMFVDFYSSKGWLVGKNKMKDWKASVRTWEKGSNNKQQDQPKRRGICI